MMTTGRADPMADMDFSDFEAKPAARAKIDVAAIREASEQQNFPSRAAHTPSPPKPRRAANSASPPPKHQQRRRRTGRSHQLNLKVTPEFAERFARLADAHGWAFAEAFEVAVVALEEKHPAGK